MRGERKQYRKLFKEKILLGLYRLDWSTSYLQSRSMNVITRLYPVPSADWKKKSMASKEQKKETCNHRHSAHYIVPISSSTRTWIPVTGEVRNIELTADRCAFLEILFYKYWSKRFRSIEIFGRGAEGAEWVPLFSLSDPKCMYGEFCISATLSSTRTKAWLSGAYRKHPFDA